MTVFDSCKAPATGPAPGDPSTPPASGDPLSIFKQPVSTAAAMGRYRYLRYFRNSDSLSIFEIIFAYIACIERNESQK